MPLFAIRNNNVYKIQTPISVEINTKYSCLKLTASVWIGCTANSIAAIKLATSGKNMEHILQQKKLNKNG